MYKLDPNHTFFTADIHFFHQNIIKYSNRPWLNVEEMHQGIIERWNNKVSDKDDVFILGDVAMVGRGNVQLVAPILKKLNGRNLYLVPGNHDRAVLKDPDCLKELKVLDSLTEISIRDSSAPRGEQLITLCHYAMKVWNKAHHGAWQLFGHSHGSMPFDYNIKSFDVGLDVKRYNYAPVSYPEVKEFMKLHKAESVDHHGE